MIQRTVRIFFVDWASYFFHKGPYDTIEAAEEDDND